eukprot:4327717-Lingulodinium_polyedra.AAC.1
MVRRACRKCPGPSSWGRSPWARGRPSVETPSGAGRPRREPDCGRATASQSLLHGLEDAGE